MWRILASFVVIFWSTLVNGQPQRPCYFIFGDSLSDAGNNNRLITMAKANYPPYGVDFPGQIPTGRFTNGRTIIDVFTELMGFENSIKIYSNITLLDQDIVRGVNFASGAAGILAESGSALGDRVWMDQQLANYALTLLKLQLMVEGPVRNYVKQCLYTITMGRNDYINNYFLPQNYPSSRIFTVQEFTRLLRTRYRAQLQTLYNSGARRVVVFGLGQLGCIPATIARNNATQCVTEINQAVQLFNTQVRSLVDDFNANLSGARFTFVNITAIQTANPLPPGELMGFGNSIKTYSNTTLLDPDIVRGVNFASGAAGILPESGSNLGDRVWMDRQLANYALTLLKLQLMVEGLVRNYVSQCLYTITMGSNDYINNYFLPQNYPTSRLFTVQQFARLLRTRFRAQLQTLYNSGARRVVVFGLGQLGCIPATIARNNATQCVTEINQAVQLFNTQVRSLVDDFNANLPGARFTFVNITAIQTANPLPPGFITDSTCCQLRSDFQCEPNTPPCADRNIYAFMDGFHPTEIVNQIAATTIFTTQNRDFLGPFSFSELLAN